MNKQNGFAGILVLVVVAIAAVAGGMYYFGIQKGGSSSSFSPSPSAISDETANWKTYTGNGYSLKVPSGYIIEEKQDLVMFQESTDSDLPGFHISKVLTQNTDPCNIKVEGYPDAKCTQIGSYRVLDWSDPRDLYIIHFAYNLIHDGYEYTFEFQDIERETKDQILSTFRFDQ